jgi:hypothetical protein
MRLDVRLDKENVLADEPYEVLGDIRIIINCYKRRRGRREPITSLDFGLPDVNWARFKDKGCREFIAWNTEYPDINKLITQQIEKCQKQLNSVVS